MEKEERNIIKAPDSIIKFQFFCCHSFVESLYDTYKIIKNFFNIFSTEVIEVGISC